MKTVIVGAGAMGCLYAALLSRAGCEVSMIVPLYCALME